MICKVCLGKGWILNENYTERIECPACHGTKETDPTNEDWFCSLSTKEKAKYFARLKKKYFWQGFNWADDEEVFGQPNTESDTRRFEKWLKEVHKG